ncbi:unnamed protein product [Schistocephalus solidus]|uniref:Tenascin-like n=2 Tax=Schistocephalus solidus TaxID=70667 RepID=A0A183SUR5_SCHSO|nr:unnamed protein product [Schistocephalus solidus]
MTCPCLSLLLLLLSTLLQLSGAGHPASSISGSVYFEGCLEDTCQKGDRLKGYGCRNGNCKLVCNDNDCYHRGIRIRRPSPDESLNLSRFRFEGCSGRYCSSGHVDGYDCQLGLCRYVCEGAVCHRGNQKTKITDRFLFKGCASNTCQLGDLVGYGCKNGRCDSICDQTGCYMGEGRQRSSAKSLSKGRFLFEHCSDNICLNGDHHGYGCSSGVCDMVCEKDECYHGDRVYHFHTKSKMKEVIVFYGCQDINCKNQRGFGYDCKTGYCAVACDDHQCFKNVASLAEPILHRSISPVNQRRIKEAKLVFHGCGTERRCQTGSTFGYNCQGEVCEYVCTSEACLHNGKPMLSLKAKEAMKKVSLYFDGCLSSICFKEDFDGFNCNRGRCALVCNDEMCFDAESYDEAYAVPKNTPPPAPQKSPEEEFDFGKELQKIQFSKFFNFGDTPFF